MKDSKTLLRDFKRASQECARWAGVDDEKFSKAFKVWDMLFEQLLERYPSEEIDKFAETARRLYRNEVR